MDLEDHIAQLRQKVAASFAAFRQHSQSNPSMSHEEYESRRLAHNALADALFVAEATLNDRRQIEAHERYYRNREAAVERQRLAELQRFKIWNECWQAWRHSPPDDPDNSLPKPAPFDQFAGVFAGRA